MIKNKVTKILISAGIVASVIGVSPVMFANAQPISKSQNYNVDSSNSSVQKVVVNTTVELSNGTANKYDMAVITGEKGKDYTIITQSGATGTISKSDVTVVKSGEGNQLVKLNETEHVIHVTTDLNVREQPNVHAGLLTTLNEGETVQVIAKEGEWFKVSINNQTGYVYNDFVGGNSGVVSSVQNNKDSNQESTQNASSTTTQKTQQATTANIKATKSNESKTNNSEVTNYKSPKYVFVNVKDGYLNMRNGAGTDHAVIAKLTNNEALKILAKEGNWYKVSTGTQVGWINGQYAIFTNTNNTSENKTTKTISNKVEAKTDSTSKVTKTNAVSKDTKVQANNKDLNKEVTQKAETISYAVPKVSGTDFYPQSTVLVTNTTGKAIPESVLGGYLRSWIMVGQVQCQGVCDATGTQWSQPWLNKVSNATIYKAFIDANGENTLSQNITATEFIKATQKLNEITINDIPFTLQEAKEIITNELKANGYANPDQITKIVFTKGTPNGYDVYTKESGKNVFWHVAANTGNAHG